ncbi:minor tail protein [Streptomyces phage R4]|uniref:Minor tail protein n=1 Tax=Streptomyces phage R4 TaxID=10732 RepID=K4I2M5_9CAUD|nr:minor tail protein [Streptomyces phage R4]AFU62075.1 minor tail protein [Streptomyces phage R4]
MPTTWYPYDNGTVGPTGPEGPQGPPGSAGTPGVVQSVNGQSVQDVVLDAADVNALPSNANAQLDATYFGINKAAGNYRVLRWLTDGASRWEAQVDDVAEGGSAAGSDFRLASRNDDGSFNKTVIHAKRSDGTISFGTTVHHGAAQVTSYGAVGLRDIGADPATASGGTYVYSKSGKLFVKQADGTSFQIAQVSYPVTSVNSKTGNVTLGAADVGAISSVSGGTAGGTVRVTGTAGTYRTLGLSTGPTGTASDRWYFQADNAAEAGGAAGSDLVITGRSDTGTFQSHAMHAKRSTGQTSFGTTSPLGEAQTTVAGAIAARDRTTDPATASGGIQLYSKAGLPYIKQGDGTVFKVGSGGGTGGGAVDSVNGKTGIVTLAASDVNALPISGGDLTGAVNINPTSGNTLTAYGSTDPATYFRVTADGHPYSNSLRATFYNLGVGDTGAPFGGGKFMLGIKDASVLPTSNPTNGVIAYSEAGKLKVRQTDGTIVTVANAPVSSVNGLTGAVNLTIEDLEGVSVSNVGQANGLATLDSGKRVPLAQIPLSATPGAFQPEDLGLKAWAGDPATCRSGYRDGSTGKGRMAAVVVRQTTTVSKIVWHFLGYAGGMKTGSWAGIYNTSGALVRGTGDLSTAAYEPAEQHGVGGGCSTSNLTSSVTLAPGTYYIAWRFNYTASPADGPLLMAFESTDVSATLYGLNAVRRFGAFATSATTAPSSVSGWETDPIRFWVALA